MIKAKDLLSKIDEDVKRLKESRNGMKEVFDKTISKAEIVSQLKLFVKLAKVIKESDALAGDTFMRAELTFIAGDVLNIIKRLEKDGI